MPNIIQYISKSALCWEATAANGYLIYLISWYLVRRRNLRKLLATAVELPEQKEMWRNWNLTDHDKCLLKLVIIVWKWNVLPKSHLLKAWSLAQCSYVEIGKYIKHEVSSFLKGLMHWLTHNLAELLEKCGKFEGRA
jgi:hypothetical protein